MRQHGGPVSLSDLVFDAASRVLRRGAELIPLARHELAVLAPHAVHLNQVVTSREILARVRGPEYGEDAGYVWTYARRLRKKLGADARSVLVNEPGVGYMLRGSEVGEPEASFA